MKFLDSLAEFIRRYLLCGNVRVAYETVDTKTELPYELRKYPASKLVCAHLQTTERSFEKNLEKTERRFNSYAKGKNSFNRAIKLPDPMVIKVRMEEDEKFMLRRIKDDDTYLVSYFVPEKYQSRPQPLPRQEQDLHFEDRKRSCYYVIRFRGSCDQEQWGKQMSKLLNYLKRDGVHLDMVDFHQMCYCRY